MMPAIPQQPQPIPAWARETPINGRTLGQQLDMQPRFAIASTRATKTAPAGLQLQPLTPAASKIMESRDGVRLEQQIGALLRTSSVPPSALKGVSLATGRAGLAANALASDVALGHQRLASEPTFLDSMKTSAIVRGYEKDYAAKDKAGAAAFGGPWLNLGPTASRQLLKTIRGGPVTETDMKNGYALTHLLRHEAQHALTPATPKTYPRYTWIEEGTAEALGRWPGAVTNTARHMGIPTKPHAISKAIGSSDGGKQYNEWTGSMQSLLRLSGIDTRSNSGLSAAQALLQKPALSRVPGKLADAIIEHNKLEPELREPIRKFIVSSGGDQKSIDSLASYVKETVELNTLRASANAEALN